MHFILRCEETIGAEPYSWEFLTFNAKALVSEIAGEERHSGLTAAMPSNFV